jgi:hypothetical protein
LIEEGRNVSKGYHHPYVDFIEAFSGKTLSSITPKGWGWIRKISFLKPYSL